MLHTDVQKFAGTVPRQGQAIRLEQALKSDLDDGVVGSGIRRSAFEVHPHSCTCFFEQKHSCLLGALRRTVIAALLALSHALHSASTMRCTVAGYQVPPQAIRQAISQSVSVLEGFWGSVHLHFLRTSSNVQLWSWGGVPTICAGAMQSHHKLWRHFTTEANKIQNLDYPDQSDMHHAAYRCHADTSWEI